VNHKYREGFGLGFLFLVTGFCNSAKHLLCHSLVRFVRYSANRLHSRHHD